MNISEAAWPVRSTRVIACCRCASKPRRLPSSVSGSISARWRASRWRARCWVSSRSTHTAPRTWPSSSRSQARVRSTGTVAAPSRINRSACRSTALLSGSNSTATSSTEPGAYSVVSDSTSCTLCPARASALSSARMRTAAALAYSIRPSRVTLSTRSATASRVMRLRCSVSYSRCSLLRWEVTSWICDTKCSGSPRSLRTSETDRRAQMVLPSRLR